MKITTYRKGEIIFRKGDYAPVMYDILNGSVGIFSEYGSEKENRIASLGAGQLLGEMGVIEAYPRSADAVAMEDGTELREIDEKEFSDYFSDQPERVLLIMRQLSQRLRRQTDEYRKALDTLSEMKGSTPDGRSKRSKARILEFLEFYGEVMAEVESAPHLGNTEPDYPFLFF